MLTSSGPKPLFACASLTALCVGLPAFLGWLGEKKRAGRPGIRGCCETARSVYDEITDRPEKKQVIRAAFLVGCFSVSLGLLQLLVGSSMPLLVGLYTVLGAVCLVCGLYVILRSVDETLARAVIFVFLKNAMCPRSRSLLFDWQHAPASGSEVDADSDWRCYSAERCASLVPVAAAAAAANATLGRAYGANASLLASSVAHPLLTPQLFGSPASLTSNLSVGLLLAAAGDDELGLTAFGGRLFGTSLNGTLGGGEGGAPCGWARARQLPCLSPVLRSWVAVVAQASGLAGTLLYATWFQTWRFRSIIALCQGLLILANLMDLVWVSRLNVALGLPDEVFAFGEEAFIDVFDQVQSQAFFIFATKLCPRQVEASRFALFMGLSNFGYDVTNTAAPPQKPHHLRCPPRVLHPASALCASPSRHFPSFPCVISCTGWSLRRIESHRHSWRGQPAGLPQHRDVHVCQVGLSVAAIDDRPLSGAQGNARRHCRGHGCRWSLGNAQQQPAWRRGRARARDRNAHRARGHFHPKGVNGKAPICHASFVDGHHPRRHAGVKPVSDASILLCGLFRPSRVHGRGGCFYRRENDDRGQGPPLEIC
jgi:hypothetical protein